MAITTVDMVDMADMADMANRVIQTTNNNPKEAPVSLHP
jgi:hypothetical protein